VIGSPYVRVSLRTDDGMKVLYYIPHLKTTGADRWIYEGWKYAFEDCGHEFFELTDYDDFRNKVQAVQPDILFVTNLADMVTRHHKFLTWVRRRGTKVFLTVYWPLRTEEVQIIRQYDVADVYFGEREPESMAEFEKTTGRRYYLIPNAANKLLHFPTQPVEKYQYDIVYLGAMLPKKKWFFDNVLLPLRKRYKVGIFGPYWTIRDNLLRAGQKLCRKVKFKAGSDFFNKLRIVIPSGEENQLYSSAKICLNFHEREPDGSQPHYIVNQRAFKIPACGGFQICDYVPALRRYFAEDEVVMAGLNAQKWFEKIDYYLTHDAERERIRQNGICRALRDHTYHARVKYCIESFISH